MLNFMLCGLLLFELVVGTTNASVAPTAQFPVKLYVVNQLNASIHVIDQQTMDVDTVLDLTTLGFSPNARPHHVAVEKDGSAWYVSLIGENRIIKFDRTNRMIGSVQTEAPGLLYIDPVRDSLYAGRSMTAPTPPRALAVIKRSSFTLTSEEPIQIARPHALAASNDGIWVHSASLAENRIASVNLQTGRTTLATIPGKSRSFVQFATSPDGRWMAVTAELSNSVLVFDLRSQSPLVPVREIVLSGKPWDCLFGKDSAKLYVSLIADNAIVEVNAATGVVSRRFSEGLAEPYSMVIRQDGNYLFAINQNSAVPVAKTGSAHEHMAHAASPVPTSGGWIAVVDLRTGQLTKKIPLGRGPTGSGAAGSR
jgi:DNA-binding beta-propeller fold protein YncE